MPSTSCEAAATLATASATGTSVGIAARAPSTENSPPSLTSSSRWSVRAAASTSYPGPRFAEEAGTRTRRRRTVIGWAEAPGSLPLDRAPHGLGLGPPYLVAAQQVVERL